MGEAGSCGQVGSMWPLPVMGRKQTSRGSGAGPSSLLLKTGTLQHIYIKVLGSNWMKGPLELHSPVHGALCATVHGATKSRIGPSDCTATTTCQRGAERRRAKLTGPGRVRTPDCSSCSTVPPTPRLLCPTKSSLQGRPRLPHPQPTATAELLFHTSKWWQTLRRSVLLYANNTV